jgi:alpha-glucosidase
LQPVNDGGGGIFIRLTEKEDMKPKIFIAVCSAFMLLFSVEAVAQKHLFLLSGQSNMVRFKPEKVFIPAVEAEFGRDNVIVIKDAQGGQPIRRWYKGWKSPVGEVPESTGDLYDRLMQKVRPAVEGQEIETVTFIWMQGEADAKAGDGEVYAASLAGIIDQLRADLKHQEINVVIGRLSDFGMDNQKCPHWTMIRDVQVAFADSNPRYEWVDTDDLNDGTDRQGRTRPNALHYSVEGYDILGKRYAQKAIALINLSAKPNVEVTRKQAEKNVPLISTDGGGFEPDKQVKYKADPKRRLQRHVFQPPGLKAGEVQIKSPDKKLVVNIFVSEGGQLMMKVARKDLKVLRPSRLGIIVNQNDLGQDAVIQGSQGYSVDEKYPWRGNHSVAVNRCNGAKILLKTGNFKWLLDVRAYNDGAAFMYSYDAGEKTLFGGESTVLSFDESLRAKFMRHSLGEESRVYSGPVTDVYDNTKTKLTMPPLLLYPEGASSYVAVLEGGGFNFHGYALRAIGGGKFKVVYAEKPDGWKIDGPVATAWKIICTVDTLNELVNTDLVANVCPPPDPKLFPRGVNEEWIKPGKSTWNWWARLSVDFETQKMLVDKAAEMGAQYHLVDIGWDQAKTWQDHTQDPYDYLKMLCDYGAKKGVGILVWKCSDTTFNLKTDSQKALAKFQKLKPVQVSRQIDQMRSEVKRIADAGAKGIKLDYINSENPKWKTYMENFLKVCAEHKLMVNFHGCPIPAGESRTYPNEVTREAIYGGEKLRGGGGAVKMPTAAYIDLVFTRMLAGHADYTPGIFNPVKGKGFTHSMQLASAVVLTSPYLCWADHPDNYLVSAGIEVIRTLPTVWDETIVMEGSALDKRLVFARKNGNHWYVAGINGDAEKQQDYELNLSFLEEGQYQAFICRDNLQTRSYAIKTEKRQVKNTDTLRLSMLPNGGFVIMFTEN